MATWTAPRDIIYWNKETSKYLITNAMTYGFKYEQWENNPWIKIGYL